MSRIINLLLTELRSLITDLGKGGGLMSPSVYDTAQVSRLTGLQEDIWPSIEWLLGQQQTDGGWGDPAVPLARDVPTLASVLSLHIHGKRKVTREAAQAGLNFLRRQVNQWRQLRLDDLPVGVELLLPWLLDEAVALSLDLSREPCAMLLALKEQRQQQIARVQPVAGTPAVHTWEAWGTDPKPTLIDGSGSVGGSPAATAAWLHRGEGITNLTDARASARCYLAQAATSTNLSIPGVVPTAWPITSFEQAYGLYILLISGLLEHPNLQDSVQPQIHALAQTLRADGLGWNEFVSSDGDDTAVAMAVLLTTGQQIDLSILRRFENEDHFCTNYGELHPSLITTAHAVHALELSGEEVTRPQQFLINCQCPDGRWLADKWQSSWLYTTLEVVLALKNSNHIKPLKSAADAILTYQRADGGWGMGSKSTSTETAYGVLALRTLQGFRFSNYHGILDALQKAYQWLLRNYRPFYQSEDKCWIGKELYRPYRVDYAFELSAMLALALEEGFNDY